MALPSRGPKSPYSCQGTSRSMQSATPPEKERVISSPGSFRGSLDDASQVVSCSRSPSEGFSPAAISRAEASSAASVRARSRERTSPTRPDQMPCSTGET